MLGKMIHPETAELLHDLLKRLARDGEEKTYAYIRNVVLKKDFPTTEVGAGEGAGKKPSRKAEKSWNW